MGKKRRQSVVHHKQTLGEQIEDPESYGVRVSGLHACTLVGCLLQARSASGCCCCCSKLMAHCCWPPQTKPRPDKRRKRSEGSDGEDDEVRAVHAGTGAGGTPLYGVCMHVWRACPGYLRRAQGMSVPCLTHRHAGEGAAGRLAPLAGNAQAEVLAAPPHNPSGFHTALHPSPLLPTR